MSRDRRQQIIREAEGYLDLLTVFGDQWPVTPSVRDRLAERALGALKRLKPTDSDGAHSLFLKGRALRTMERYREAIEPLQRAAELNPENIQVWLALGWCHKRCGRIGRAIESLEEGLAIASEEAILHYNLACYWSVAGNVRLAVGFLSQAFQIDPNYRDLVADETDFDPVRQRPEFQALTSAIV